MLLDELIGSVDIKNIHGLDTERMTHTVVSMFVSTPNSYVEILALKGDGLIGGSFGRCLGHEGGHEWDWCLIKEAPQRSLVPFTM